MKLRDYQERISTEAAQCIKDNGCAYLSMECRTGKTLTALVTAQKYGAKRVLFITRLKAIPSVMHDYETLQKETPPFEIDVVNYESAHKSVMHPDFVILDEAHCMGAYPKPSKRTKTVKERCKGLPVLLMSGTPTPESYSQIFHQFWVCDQSPFKDYPNFYHWANDGFVFVKPRKVNGYTINDYSNANKNKIDRMVKHLFFSYSQEEAGFSCNVNEKNLDCFMGHQTYMALRTIKRDKVLNVGPDEVVVADTPAKLLSKMHQISGGTVITEDGKHKILDRSKAFAIKNAFPGKKIAVFYVYQSEFDLLKEVFPRYTESPEEFQECSDKVFISQIRKAREGVRLDSADAIIFYNLEYSYLSYEQGKNRIVSKERTTPADVYFAVSNCGIESDILEAVRGKEDFTLSYYKKHGNF